MIEVIIFDVGGTYMQGSLKNFLIKAHAALGITKTFGQVKEVFFTKEFNEGKESIEETFQKYFKVEISTAQMKHLVMLWKQTWSPSEEMLQLVKQLKKRYRLAILSNSDKPNSENYSEKGWYAPFEVLILSHIVGMIKPKKEIYELTLKKLNITPDKCLFIDNQEECLKPARELGMKTLLFHSLQQLKEDLNKLSVKY